MLPSTRKWGVKKVERFPRSHTVPQERGLNPVRCRGLSDWPATGPCGTGGCLSVCLSSLALLPRLSVVPGQGWEPVSPPFPPGSPYGVCTWRAYWVHSHRETVCPWLPCLHLTLSRQSPHSCRHLAGGPGPPLGGEPSPSAFFRGTALGAWKVLSG